MQSYKVEVKETPEGMIPPAQNVVRKAPHQPSRLRKFMASNSAGLRVRAHPSLQSEQIGIVPVSGVIAFIDEVINPSERSADIISPVAFESSDIHLERSMDRT